VPDNPGGLVYGTILVATLLAAENARHETYETTIGSVVLALIVYWLAISYATFTGARARRGGHFELAGFMHAIGREIAVIYGTAGPLAALLVCWASAATLSTAISAAVWTAAATIVASEIVIGVRSELRGRELVIQTAFGAVLGLLVVALRVLLH
jgi:hypothetical protein